MRILSLTRYDRLGASSRLRSLQYFPALEAAGHALTHWPLFDDAYLRRLYARQPNGAWQRRALGRRMAQLRAVAPGEFDLIWLEKELFPWLPYALEQFFLPRGAPLAIDYDDAIFHNYDRHRLWPVRRLLGRKIDRLMARADLVIGGSPYLCERAEAAGARRVEYLPTVVDLDRYPAAPSPAGLRPVIGWMGTPMTVKFLRPLLPVLRELAAEFDFELRVIGAEIAAEGVPIVCERWSEAGEAEALRNIDIGIMPLADSPWERGKCGYKLIQYMACAKPVMASPVGVNRLLVEEGVNGFCAATPDEWRAGLRRLLADAELRHAAGRASRAKVEQHYCLQRTAPRLLQLFQDVVHGT